MDTEPKAAEASLAGRVALVTGAGSRGPGIGNGRAAAILLARAGARVGLIDSQADWAEATRRMIEAEGGQAAVLECDVTRDASCRDVVAATLSRWGRVDILVNNVGVGGPPGSAVDLDLEGWDQAMRVNVTAMMLMARHAIPPMRELGRGAIVNIASVAGLMGGHPSLLYPASKGAVVGMTRAMAAHHGPEGIRVNCVAPGMVYTPMVSANGMSAEKRALRRARSLLTTEGNGWDVGHAVRYLASDEARFITGTILSVDGGAVAGRPVGGASPDHAYLRPTESVS
ncbi:SDR family oxidoreductase [Rhodovarius crocodyli]|uniref:SDR family oxidoreductase n=1 Tax=Rhodovarius crocodyli TaxID=1979269 RepID=A0A437M268_9PROT|nr:SDR family NAD(P)-dependent oxidoreductase [Rhodovarius crocodyli]RVT91777.1 SDR family oxidoreductase [Rhodovarius crocodyli]